MLTCKKSLARHGAIAGGKCEAPKRRVVAERRLLQTGCYKIKKTADFYKNKISLSLFTSEKNHYNARMSILLAMQGAVSQGVLWGIMTLGVYLTFRILNIADMTCDGSFALGGST